MWKIPKKKPEPLALKDIFLFQKGKYTNLVSVIRGLNHVRRELLGKRLRDYRRVDRAKYFFKGNNEPNDNFEELMDFWEVFKEYLAILKPVDVKQFFPLLNLVYLMDGNYYSHKYQKIISEKDELFVNQIEDLCLELSRNQCIKILDLDLNERMLLSLETFEENEFECNFVKYHIAKLMIDGGVITVNDSDEIPIKGYILKNDTWKKYAKEQLLTINQGEEEMVNLRGIH